MIDAFPRVVGRILRHAVHLDGVSRQVRRNFHQSDAVLGQCQHECRLFRRHRPKQRLNVETIADLRDGRETIGQSKGSQTRWRDEHGQAVGLVLPELIVVNEVKERFLDRADFALVVFGQLPQRLARLILQGDPVRLSVLRDRRGGQV